jgi:hypothetical protein
MNRQGRRASKPPYSVYGLSFQRDLAMWNRSRLAPDSRAESIFEELRRDYEMQVREARFLESLRAEVAAVAALVPTDPNGFATWFENLRVTGPGQNDPLFPWLADSASPEEIRWFFEQEVGGEAGFDDLVALTQVKLPIEPKLELARNYWDEMGRGNAKGMHGPMLDSLAKALRVQPSIATTIRQSLALANAMTAMATKRRYAWHSVGALGVIELTAPRRAAYVSKALQRIGLTGRERHYFDLHAVLDVKHSAAWNEQAIRPAVAAAPERAAAIAEGALIRLRCGARCFQAYRDHLWRQPRADGGLQQREKNLAADATAP